MPLHLLPKKSWNPYSTAAISRVRADEAAAAAAEEARDEQLRDHEAAKRLALLRGEEEPIMPAGLGRGAEVGRMLGEGGAEKRRREDGGGGGAERDEKRRRRRLAGEDDTDRDIRLARVEEEERVVRRDGGSEGGATATAARLKKEGRDGAVPLLDHRGNIQLFAPPSVKQIREGKREEGDKEKKRAREEKEKKEAEESAVGMRLSDAAGFKTNVKEKPWYANGRGYSGTEEVEALTPAEESGDGNGASVGRDAFGREDAGRVKRDQVRLRSSDPMAAMRSAQAQLKAVERSRRMLEEERHRELDALKEEQEREERREARKKRRRREEEDGENRGNRAQREGEHGHHHGRHRHRSRGEDGRARVEA